MRGTEDDITKPNKKGADLRTGELKRAGIAECRARVPAARSRPRSPRGGGAPVVGVVGRRDKVWTVEAGSR